jgi:hypothetical protein
MKEYPQAKGKAKAVHTIYWSGRVSIKMERMSRRVIRELRHGMKTFAEARMRGQVRPGKAAQEMGNRL